MQTMLEDSLPSAIGNTRKEQQYRPFESARRFIAPLGIKSKVMFKRWKDGLNGIGTRPSDIPANPKKTYASEWRGWGHFLSKRSWMCRFLRDTNKQVIRELERNPIHWTQKTDEGYIEWIRQEQRNGWVFLKLDVTFASSGDDSSEDWFRNQYHNYVIPAIKSITRNSYQFNDLIAEYEFGIRGRNRQTVDWRHPHHVHAILGVRCTIEQASVVADRINAWGDPISMKVTQGTSTWISSAVASVIPADELDESKTVRKAYFYMRKKKLGRSLH